MKCDVCKQESMLKKVPLLSPRLKDKRDMLCEICAKRRLNSQISQKLMKQFNQPLKDFSCKVLLDNLVLNP